MNKSKTTIAHQIAEQIAELARTFQERQTGHAPRAVSVVLSEDTLVVTLHEALSPAEKALATSQAGAAQVQDFHRQLFQNSVDSLRSEIERITGRQVRESSVEVEPRTSAVVHAFTTGTVVQVFLLASRVAAASGSASELPYPS